MPIITNIDIMLAKKNMSVSKLANKIGISIVNLSRIKNGNVKGIRYSTLNKICEVLECKPGDILDYEKNKNYHPVRMLHKWLEIPCAPHSISSHYFSNFNFFIY